MLASGTRAQAVLLPQGTATLGRVTRVTPDPTHSAERETVAATALRGTTETRSQTLIPESEGLADGLESLPSEMVGNRLNLRMRPER